MEPQVNLRVSYRGETQSFLVSDTAHTTWADVEAMVKVSFDLDDIQIKYIDEDNDEVSVNSKEEYEEALKIAVKQGNQLQMNVYEESSPLKETSSCSWQLHEKTVTEKLAVLKDELAAQQKLNHNRTGRTNQSPPEWFTSYLETFREQVVKETVEQLEQKLYEKLIHHNQSSDFSESSVTTAPPNSETQTKNGNQCDWLISCCNCQARIVGVRYQCSLCPAYNICEQCEAGMYAHDPNHILLKLRRPMLCIAENYDVAQFSPCLPTTLEQVRLQKQIDKRFLKAEKQRLRAEKKQRKAEVRELKKQLKLHRKIHLWNSVPVLETSGSPTLKSENLQHSTIPSLSQHFQAVVPTLSAVFVDENLPDGTRLQPGTKFIKHWRMKNTGNVEWSSDTKLKLMWGNLTLASSEKKDVLVPSIPTGQVGTVSVEFVAPNIEGTYTSHWRLSHRGEQFGPRIWCSIVVDPSPATDSLESNWKDFDSRHKGDTSSNKQDAYLKTERNAHVTGEIVEQAEISLPAFPLKMKNLASEREFYIPSVDLLTAQDLLSFELLDINIVQELERVPHNTPVDMTPCMSPLPHDSLLLEKPGLDQIDEENEGSGFKPVSDTSVVKMKTEHPLNQEEGEEDMSGTQFVCETVIRSLTLDAAPDHKPPQKKKSLENELLLSDGRTDRSSITVRSDEDEGDDKDDVQSQGSSTSSEDYIIILPECFDTSRPLGESMYSSALSQPSLEKTGDSETRAGNSEGERQPQMRSISNILTTSQTLAVVPLAPEVVDTLPQTERNLASLQNHIFQEPNIPTSENVSSTPYNEIREEPSGEDRHEPGSSVFLTSIRKGSEYARHPQGGSIAGDLVKGALSVAASAYKALFAGPPITEQPAATEEHTAALLSSLCEMGFCDRQLNLRLLKKHNNNMVQVVTELLQISNSDWYSNRC
ncbi:next to BRCA1 gene 1 protein isoform X1 [Gallus gallus]|uniref:Next to BRCA1 gene 1 protein n=2 Tax=Gallus gallus TaxID=9031 RepID=E1C6F8_CHICK|nr:next to BRCA1 gene 1 protein isoform X1 [Gallus gallus]XP_040548309.1 next to BRCA1 gene 1 protein isoform X1 [Gallus gallus]XP_040548310.1 next to BRCA1 gene 1 protein isoform X1 [Gallus gallus]XP_046760424.1 next to BRCA1 gene 1 protein isoform X1 [Gallus gallus]XP_046789532.1 next to BRCA1 gene 1 protein isoform X1 [Gallus gallus]XP_418128.4 next to BRCA1 gene 1 protein isoform X1 [Gallus gallus]|eukprot:XP_418128.4 next to BRCA1 gene 1 protein isoform X1 [Gallus gallus]